MSGIRVLPTQLVNKIAAGECIERPASVVKELVENALDAGAGKIEVAVEQGGAKRIRVVDDGGGIEPDQLPLAVTPHATSKLRDEDDLYAIGSMGFRGEALASIASVSRVAIRSVRADADSGGSVEVGDGRCGPVTPYAGAVGTTVEVQNLFYNTPARRKFLKTAGTEFGHIQEQITRTALAHPQTTFRLQHNERTVLDLRAVESPRDRIGDIFGGELAEPLLQVFCQDERFTFQAYISRPDDSKPNNRWQYVFVNRRPVRDRYIGHALREAYRGLIAADRQPVAFIFLELDPTIVDVNVHPTKSEVRFRDSGEVHSLVLGAIRDRFLSADLPAPLIESKAPPPVPPTTTETPSDAKRETIKQSVTAAVADFMKSAKPEQPAFTFEPRAPVGKRPHVGAAVEAPPPPRFDIGRSAVQIHNTYLVVQTDDGLMIIDQHALHERVLYEKLKRHLQSGPVPRQRLLAPHVVNLTAQHLAQIESIKTKLHEIGIEIEPFGPQAVAVHSLPAMIENVDSADLLEDLLGRLEDAIEPDPTDVVEHILESVACKAAVKAGDPLSAQEIVALLEYRRQADLISTCPHGRPTALHITLDELQKRFKRT